MPSDPVGESLLVELVTEQTEEAVKAALAVVSATDAVWLKRSCLNSAGFKHSRLTHPPVGGTGSNDAGPSPPRYYTVHPDDAEPQSVPSETVADAPRRPLTADPDSDDPQDSADDETPPIGLNHPTTTVSDPVDPDPEPNGDSPGDRQ